MQYTSMMSIESMSADELYMAGTYWSDVQYTPAIAEKLIGIEDAGYLIKAGKY